MMLQASLNRTDFKQFVLIVLHHIQHKLFVLKVQYVGFFEDSYLH